MEINPLLIEETKSSTYFTPIKLSKDYLLTSENNTTRIFSTSPLQNLSNIQEKSVLFDYIWHPSSLFYLALVKRYPMMLRDHSHSTVQKFPVFNHLQELRTPIAATMTNQHVYTVLGNNLKLYDIETSLKLHEVEFPLRPRAITSAVAVSDFVAVVGSYSSDIFAADTRVSNAHAHLGNQEGGVIQVEIRDCFAITGGRKDNSVLVWDLRKPELHLSCYRLHSNHQRILFDCSQSEVVVGNADGSIYKYDIASQVLKWCFMAHFDAVNSVQVQDKIYSSSGQRHIEYSDDNKSMIRTWDLQNNI